jgi:hypothetical protein
MSDLPTPEDTKRDQEAMKSAVQYKKVNPLKGLPEYLKDPKNYLPVQKALLETLNCGKLHSDPSQAFHCSKCTENMQVRRELMRKFGFRNAAQYMAWKKTHENIKARMPLEMYNRMLSGEKV